MEDLLRGRFQEARNAIDQVLAVRPDIVQFQVSHTTQNVWRLLSCGQADEARPIAELLDSSPAADNSQLVGVAAVAQGDLDTPGAVLDAWHAAGHQLPVDAALPGRLWGLAE